MHQEVGWPSTSRGAYHAGCETLTVREAAMAIEGLHHITIGALDAQRTSISTRPSRAPVREEDGQLRRSAPPTICNFGDAKGTPGCGDHLLRVAGRAERPPRHRRHASRGAQGRLRPMLSSNGSAGCSISGCACDGPISTASTSPRSTSAIRTASSSRSRRSVPAGPSTSRRPARDDGHRAARSTW